MDNGKSPVNSDEQNAELGADSPPAAEPVAPPPASDLAAERDQLILQAAELNDRILRLRADYDNFRRRAERDRAEVFDYATMEAVRPLLPILDDFERALQAAPAPDDYTKGIELIYQRLGDALAKLGLEPIDAAGQPFDPNLHHAVQTEPREDCDDHTVVEQYQRGYNFKGKLLRAAMVKVAVKP